MGRLPKTSRSYLYAVTGVDIDAHPFRLETDNLTLARQITPWRGTLWTVEQDGSRRMLAKFRQGRELS